MSGIIRNNVIKWPVLSLLFFPILYIAYIPDQSDFFSIFPMYCLCFAAYALLNWTTVLSVKEIIVSGVLVRIIVLFSIPALSDDIYRYIWDGMVSMEGINPYAYTPAQLVEKFPDFAGTVIFPYLNSPNYYSVYPFIPQVLFIPSAIAFSLGIPIQIFIMKCLVIFAEISTVIILPKLLSKLKFDPGKAGWYILNPLILLELNANAHLESIMVFFLVCGFYLFVSGKKIPAMVAYMVSVATKIIPLLLVPIIFFNLRSKLRLQFSAFTAVTIFLILLPSIILQNSTGIFSSLELYFDHFEFNASIYYVFRYIGQLLVGYNTIAFIGPVLTIFSGLLILYIGLKPNNKDIQKYGSAALFMFTVYLIFSTTVHPWYISSLIFLSCFSTYKYPILWSFLIYLSYYNYHGDSYHESYGLVIIEYTLLFSFIIYELKKFNSLRT